MSSAATPHLSRHARIRRQNDHHQHCRTRQSPSEISQRSSPTFVSFAREIPFVLQRATHQISASFRLLRHQQCHVEYSVDFNVKRNKMCRFADKYSLSSLTSKRNDAQHRTKKEILINNFDRLRQPLFCRSHPDSAEDPIQRTDPTSWISACCSDSPPSSPSSVDWPGRSACSSNRADR